MIFGFFIVLKAVIWLNGFYWIFFWKWLLLWVVLGGETFFFKLLSCLLLFFLFLGLRRVMSESGLITCYELASKPIEEIVYIEKGGASFCRNLRFDFSRRTFSRLGFCSLQWFLTWRRFGTFNDTTLTLWFDLCKIHIIAFALLHIFTFLTMLLVMELLWLIREKVIDGIWISRVQVCT